MMKRLILLAPIALLLSQCAEESADHNAASEASKPRSINERFNNRYHQRYVNKNVYPIRCQSLRQLLRVRYMYRFTAS